MTPGDPDSVKPRIIKSVPLGRYGEPDELAALVAFLASTDASYITGGIYTVATEDRWRADGPPLR